MNTTAKPLRVSTNVAATKGSVINCFQKIGKVTQNSMEFSGRMLLNSFNAGPPAGVPFSTIYNALLSPNLFPGSRLSAMAALYEKFVFTHAKLIWVPQAPTSTPGSVALSWDSDPTTPTPAANLVGYSQHINHACSVQTPIWEHASITILSPKGFLGFTDCSSLQSDERMCYQGQIYVATPVNNVIIGSLYIEYTCVLVDPQISPIYTGNAISSLTKTQTIPATTLAVFAPIDPLAGFSGAETTSPQNIPTLSSPIPGGAGRCAFVIPPLSQYDIIINYVLSSNTAYQFGIRFSLVDGSGVSGTALGASFAVAEIIGNTGVPVYAIVRRALIRNDSTSMLFFYFDIRCSSTINADYAILARRVVYGSKFI